MSLSLFALWSSTRVNKPDSLSWFHFLTLSTTFPQLLTPWLQSGPAYSSDPAGDGPKTPLSLKISVLNGGGFNAASFEAHSSLIAHSFSQHQLDILTIVDTRLPFGKKDYLFTNFGWQASSRI
jgi:hypothetical protein